MSSRSLRELDQILFFYMIVGEPLSFVSWQSMQQAEGANVVNVSRTKAAASLRESRSAFI